MDAAEQGLFVCLFDRGEERCKEAVVAKDRLTDASSWS